MRILAGSAWIIAILLAVACSSPQTADSASGDAQTAPDAPVITLSVSGMT